ncbi:MAG: protein kinase, partial [Acidobacteriota bacterium]
ARAAGALKHPRIVAIYEVGEVEGQPYFSMDLIEGENLATLLRQGPLDPHTAAELVMSLADTVHYAHQQGIIHRDLKPSNVVVDARFDPHITDFGLAKDLTLNHSLTLSGAVLGTPGYIPPENAASTSNPASPAADIYALGAILYATLVGRAPFDAETPVATLVETLQSQPEPPSQLRPVVPHDLELISLRCLEKDPADRYPSADELAEDLSRFLQGLPIEGGKLGRGLRLRRRLFQQPWLGRVRIGVALTVLALAFAGWFGLQQQGFFADLSSEPRQTLSSRSYQRDTLLAEARAHRQQGERHEALEKLAQAAKLDLTPEVRREALETHFLPGLHPAIRFEAPRYAYMSFSDDGQRLALLGADVSPKRLRLEVRDATTGALLDQALSETDAPKPTIRGGELGLVSGASTETPKMWVWNRREGRLLPSKIDRELALASPQAQDAWIFSPSKRWLAMGPTSRSTPQNPPREVRIVSMWQPHAATLPAGSVLGDFLDDEYLLYLKDGAIFMWDLFEDTSHQPAPPHAILDVSSDRGFAALRPSHDVIEVWDLRRRLPTARLNVSSAGSPVARLSSQGQLLATGGGSEPLRVWDLADPQHSYKSLQPAEERSLDLRQTSFNPQGTLLAVPGMHRDRGKVWVWDIASAKVLAVLDGWQPTWDPSGARLATLGTDPAGKSRGAKVTLWDVASPAPSRRLSNWIGSLSFDAEGDRFTVDTDLWWDGSSCRQAGGPTSLDLPQPVDPRQHRLSTPLSDGRPIDFRGLQPRQELMILPEFPRVEPFADGGTAHIYPYRWAITPSGDAMVLASIRTESSSNDRPVSPTVSNRSSYLLEHWDLANGSLLGVWSETRQVGAIAISPDGETTAVGGHLSEGIDLCHTKAGVKIERLEHDALIKAVTFSLDSQKVASVGLNDRIEVSHVTGEKIASWQAEPGIRALAFDDSGELLASADDSPIVRVWHIASGRELVHWQAHESAVVALATRPGTGQLVTGGCDGRLRAWDLQAARQQLESRGITW